MYHSHVSQSYHLWSSVSLSLLVITMVISMVITSITVTNIVIVIMFLYMTTLLIYYCLNCFLVFEFLCFGLMSIPRMHYKHNQYNTSQIINSFNVIIILIILLQQFIIEHKQLNVQSHMQPNSQQRTARGQEIIPIPAPHTMFCPHYRY